MDMILINKNKKSLFIWLTLFFFSGLPPTLYAADKATAPKHVIIVSSSDSAPFEFVDNEGKPQGIFIDLWRLWSKKTGVTINIRPVPWAKTLEMMKSGDADIHAGLFYSKKRNRFLDYGPELYASDTHIFYNYKIKNIRNPDDLQSFKIGVIKGDLAVDFFHRNYPGLRLTLFKDNNALFDAAANGTIKVFIKDTPIALYNLNRRHLLARFNYRKKLPIYSNMFYAGVRRGDKALLHLVQKGINQISQTEKDDIEDKWLHSTSTKKQAKTLKLTAKEQKWLHQHQSLRLGVDPSWPPFEFFNQTKVYSGIASDYVHIVSQLLGIDMLPVKGITWSEVLDRVAHDQIDVLPCVTKSPARSRYLLFSKPYLNIPMVIVTRAKFPMVSSVNDFDANKLAVVKDYISHDILRRKFPHLKLYQASSVNEALLALNDGKVDGFIGNSAAISYASASLGLTKLKVAANTPYSFSLSMAVRKDLPQLLPILNKALAAVDSNKSQQINKYWTRIRIEHKTDWRAVRNISAAISFLAFLIIAVFAYWNHKLNKEIKGRKLAERQLLKVTEAVEQSSVSVIITDHEGNIEYVNPHFSEISGYSPSETIGQNPRVLKSGQHDKEFYTDLWQTILAGHIWRGDFCNKKKNGDIYWESASIAPITDEHGKITNFVAVKEDITQRKEMENELRHTRDIAEKATRAKSDFLAHMSHEIRTPMNAVLGMTHLCLQTPLSIKQSDYLQKIDLAARSLLRIINDVLDFSKIEAGKLSMEKKEFFFDEILDSIASMAGLAAQKKGLEIIFDRHHDVPDGLVGDPLRLGQILLNLVNNAIKFTENGQITVKIDIESMARDKVILQCAVIDTGIGISPTDQKHLFQSFSQADDSVTRRFGGTGLGLVICRNLVEMMNGRIWLESRPGQGSTFFFTAELGRHRQARKTHSLPTSLSDILVLVVDDNKSFLQIIVEMLQYFNFKVITAESGEEALDILTKSKASCDLILMDRFLPGIGGVDTLNRLQRKLSHMPPTILMSAYGSATPAESNFDIPLLAKPFTSSSLLDAIVNRLCAPPNDKKSSENLSEIADISGSIVLVAEDNPLNMQFAQELLQSWGLIVEVAGNGAIAVDMVSKKDYDLIMLDIQMPVMDGLTATRKIREMGGDYATIPILAMTANVLKEDRQKSMDAGMNDHIGKPLDPDSLRQALGRWLGKGANKTNGKTQSIKHHPTFNGIDYETAVKRLAGNDELYRQLLRDFCNDHRDTANAVQQSLAANKQKEARQLAHSLKGVSGNLGAITVHAAATKLEKAILAGDKSCHKLLQKLDEELKALFAEIEQFAGCAKLDESAHPQLNKVEIQESLQELQHLIAKHDIDALACFNSLSPSLSQYEQWNKDLQKYLAHFNFNEATEVLAKISTQMES